MAGLTVQLLPASFDLQHSQGRIHGVGAKRALQLIQNVLGGIIHPPPGWKHAE